MKKAMLLSVSLVLCIVTALWVSPCQAQEMNACAKKKNGQLRVVSDPSQCKKSEYPVVLNGSAPATNPIPAFAGKVCWNYVQTETEDGSENAGPFQLTLFVHYLGDDRYSVQGLVYPGPTEIMLLTGSAMVIGDYIYISLPSSAQQSPTDDDRNVHIHQIKLSKTSLDGTLWAVTTSYNPSNRTFDHNYTSGPLTKKASCQ